MAERLSPADIEEIQQLRPGLPVDLPELLDQAMADFSGSPQFLLLKNLSLGNFFEGQALEAAQLEQISFAELIEWGALRLCLLETAEEAVLQRIAELLHNLSYCLLYQVYILQLQCFLF